MQKNRKEITSAKTALTRKIMLKDSTTITGSGDLSVSGTPKKITPAEVLATMSPDVQAIYHKEPEMVGGLPICTQPVCKPDPRMTIQVVDEKHLYPVSLPWRLPGAFRGYLVMSPGGTNGTIGGLLYQMDQYYSHMGIVTKELPLAFGAYEVRHATGLQDRLQDFPHESGDDETPNAPLHYHGQEGLENAPTDGFQEQALRNGWPGTISQSVQEIVTGMVPGMLPDGTPGDIPRKWTDPVSGQEYKIHELTLDPTYMIVKNHGNPKEGQNTVVDAIFVRPPNGMESPEVLNALGRIADEASDLNAHYRFYCYTKGDIGMDRNYDGPILTVENATTKDPYCAVKKIMATSTAAAVCSSFVWTAVQIANKKAKGTKLPQIVLDGRPDYFYDTSLVGTEFFRREPLQPAIPFLYQHVVQDGLYFYNETLRKTLADWLYNSLHDKAVKEVNDSADLAKWLSENTTVLGVNIYKLLNNFSLKIVQQILGLTDDALAELVILFSDLPSDIANQITNSFANDDCSVAAKDSEAWKTPGTGMAVSPDDIINAWTYPTSPRLIAQHKLNPDLSGMLLGVYGWNWPVVPCPPQRCPDMPHFSWEISLGDSAADGRITYSKKDSVRAGQGIMGARIYIGCTVITSGQEGWVRHITVPSGKYMVRAVFDDPVTGLHWQSQQKIIDFEVGSSGDISLELDPPAGVNRLVKVGAHWHIVNVYLVGKNWIGNYDDNPQLNYMGEGVSLPNPLNSHGEFPAHAIDDWGDAELIYDLSLNKDDLSVIISCKARMESDDDDDWIKFEFTVPAKKVNSEPSTLFSITLTRDAGPFPITGDLKITVDNNIMPGGLP